MIVYYGYEKVKSDAAQKQSLSLESEVDTATFS